MPINYPPSPPLEIDNIPGLRSNLGSPWRYGSSSPVDADGIEGSYYHHTSTDNIYHKISGTYVLVGNFGASSVAWVDITSKPTTLSGYGITDAATSSQLASKQDFIPTGTSSQYWRGDKTWQTLDWNSISSKPSFGNSAFLNIGTTTSTVASGDDSRIVNALNTTTGDARYGQLGSANTWTNTQGIRAAIGSNAAGLYVPWISGDTLPTASFGSSNASNNQPALRGVSFSGNAAQLTTTSGTVLPLTTASGLLVDGLITGGSFGGLSAGSIRRVRSATTPTANFGIRDVVRLQSSTTNDQDASQESTYWIDPTHATRTSRRSISTSLSGTLAERFSVDAGNGASTTGLMLWDVDSGVLKRVQLGLANSGGVGYRMLTIAN